MSARIVLLGWEGHCVEFSSALDADALRNDGVVRASLMKVGGPLTDATILVFEEHYLDSLGGREAEHAHKEALRRLLQMPLYQPREFDVEIPLPPPPK